MDNKQRINENTAKIEALTKRLEEITISGGGGSSDIGSGDYYLKVIDYDGTILAEKRLNAGDTYTLPNAPSHNGLVFQEWSCSQDIVDGVITIADNNVMVGATYTTASGLSEFDITLTKVTGLNVKLNMNGTKNWGDGTIDTLNAHTYAEYGDYTITCDGTTMSTNSSNALFGQYANSKNSYCINARLGAGVTTMGAYAFMYCVSLRSIVIPQSIKTMSNSIFGSCYALTSVVIPKSVTIVDNSLASSCHSLTSVVIPQGVITINDRAFSACYCLKNVIIPKSVTTIGTYVFSQCYALPDVVIPQAVTTIGERAFDYCYSVAKYDFTKHSTIPTLNSGVFAYINSVCKIYVPDNLYNEWIVATNWASYEKYIYKASEMPKE